MDMDNRPVLTGVIALVAVAVVVGLLAGVAVVAGTRVVGLGESAASNTASTGPRDKETLFVPKPRPTTKPEGPLITLEPGAEPAEDSSDSEGGDPDEESAEEEEAAAEEKREKGDQRISLSAVQTSVAQMERIDLMGTYPAGEGAVLRVQRFVDGAWSNFPVTVPVANQTFTTYIQTSGTGAVKFRVLDLETGAASNPVSVTIT